MRNVALFDFCKTLVTFDTHDPFIKLVLLKERKFAKFLIATVLSSHLVRLLQRFRVLRLHNKKQYLVSLLDGIETKKVEKWADLYAEKLLRHSIQDSNMELAVLHARNVVIYVISAGLSVYIKKYMQKKHPNVNAIVIANDLTSNDGVCDGTYTATDCIGSEKVIRYNAQKKEDEQVVATYSDSYSDKPIIDLAAYGYLITRSGNVVFWKEHVFSRRQRVKQSIWKTISRLLPDATYIKYAYRRKHGRTLDLSAPKHLTELIQKYKLDRTSELDVRACDKVEAKKLIGELGFPELQIPTLQVCTSPNQVNFDDFADEDVIYKCNHDSQGGVIARAGSIISRNAIRNHLQRRLNRNHYTLTRERAYKNIKPQVIVEQLILDDGKVPNDLKIHCFNGEVQFIYLSIDREERDVRLIVDRNWEKTGMFWNPAGSTAFDHDLHPPKPDNLEQLIRISESLARNWSYCRIDLYNTSKGIFFGEITLFPHGGLELIRPLRKDAELGALVNS